MFLLYQITTANWLRYLAMLRGWDFDKDRKLARLFRFTSAYIFFLHFGLFNYFLPM